MIWILSYGGIGLPGGKSKEKDEITQVRIDAGLAWSSSDVFVGDVLGNGDQGRSEMRGVTGKFCQVEQEVLMGYDMLDSAVEGWL